MNTRKLVAAIAPRGQAALWRLCGLVLCHVELARKACPAIALAVSLLAGCAALPEGVARSVSQSRTDVAGTALAHAAAAALPGGTAAMSGLRLLPSGAQALDARIALARAAEKCIDAQYYLVADDLSGRQFLGELRDAAARGVRVRLLVDDLFAGGENVLLEGLAAHANIEVRLFNPLPVRRGGLYARVLWSLHEAARINRRMHNKLFIADNSFAVVGGRNIANEYFDRSRPANFIDLDALVAGAAVRELSDSFDAYWNAPLSYAIEAIATAPAEPAAARARFAALVRDAGRHEWAAAGARDALGRDAVGEQLLRGGIELQPAQVRVVADALEQARSGADDTEPREGAVMSANLELFARARTEVLVVSPYVAPVPRMSDALRQAGRAGARVSVVTNSLATTDEPLAHFGYARHRAALLTMGIALYELMPERSASRAVDDDARSGSLARLHAKLAVVDRRWFYVGSMNMDRRSAHCNTELGLVVESTALAGELADLVHRERLPMSFSVSAADGATGLQWRDARGGRARVFDSDPDASWGQLLWGTMLGWWMREEWL